MPMIHRLHLPQAETINGPLLEAYWQLDRSAIRQTHHFHGRFENTYVPLAQIPALQPVVDAGLAFACNLLGRDQLRYGFWFNEMGPGQMTSRHNHDEDDELLSGCYYIQVPKRSGRFIAEEAGEEIPIQPKEGLFLFFSPSLMHAVEENLSQEIRLSVAFNFGRAEAEG